MPRPICEFYTAKFTRCTRGCDAGGHYCRTHTPKAELLGPRPAEGHCLCLRRIMGEERWCGLPHRAGETTCDWHWRRTEERAVDAQRRQARAQLVEMNLQTYLNQEPRQPWEEVTRQLRWRAQRVRDAFEYLPDGIAFDVARRFFFRTTPDTMPATVFHDYWVQLWQEEQGIWMAAVPPAAAAVAAAAPPPQPQGQMARLAADTQNVHREVVVKQSNSNVELLLAEPVPATQETLTMLTTWWLVRGPKPDFATYWKVMEDVHHWYGKRTCKATGDFLYRRVLDGLTAKILLATDGNDELFAELTKRLWEECEEAVGMCCEGHISRLANVLVGFDETFRPPVPVGEILQTKMAAIAELKLSHKLKLQKAVAVMDELNIPVAERAPWLEALEE